jgi:uncharacterized protein YdiU (UPF0061 family)
MNTDNTSVAGETIDYGPCAFLDVYEPNKSFSSIDRQGRYAFMNQPRIALWNLARFGEALLPLIHDDEEEAARVATAVLERFGAAFEDAYAEVVRRKIGLRTEREGDAALRSDLYERLRAGRVDHTLFFRHLRDAEGSERALEAAASLFQEPGAFIDWAARWKERLAAEESTPAERRKTMERANPVFIPRNHRVEEALLAATSRGDYRPFDALSDVLAHPYDAHPDYAYLEEPPGSEWSDYRTFCGT